MFFLEYYIHAKSNPIFFHPNQGEILFSVSYHVIKQTQQGLAIIIRGKSLYKLRIGLIFVCLHIQRKHDFLSWQIFCVPSFHYLILCLHIEKFFVPCLALFWKLFYFKSSTWNFKKIVKTFNGTKQPTSLKPTKQPIICQ